MHEEASLFANPILWYSIAVIVFVVAMVWKAGKPIVGLLDAEIAKVRTELQEARRLRDEAAATLADYRRRQQEALKEAETIIARAKEEAHKLREEAQTDLEAMLARYESKAEDRIRSAEADALAEVRDVVIEQAVAVAQKALASKVDPSLAEKLVSQAIAEMPKLASKSKVA